MPVVRVARICIGCCRHHLHKRSRSAQYGNRTSSPAMWTNPAQTTSTRSSMQIIIVRNENGFRARANPNVTKTRALRCQEIMRSRFRAIDPIAEMQWRLVNVPNDSNFCPSSVPRRDSPPTVILLPELTKFDGASKKGWSQYNHSSRHSNWPAHQQIWAHDTCSLATIWSPFCSLPT